MRQIKTLNNGASPGQPVGTSSNIFSNIANWLSSVNIPAPGSPGSGVTLTPYQIPETPGQYYQNSFSSLTPLLIGAGAVVLIILLMNKN